MQTIMVFCVVINTVCVLTGLALRDKTSILLGTLGLALSVPLAVL